jgi:hypothetical protein
MSDKEIIIILRISEPWEASTTLTGRIIRKDHEHDRTYLFFEDNKSGDIYLLSSRYVGEDASDVILGKKVNVAIYILDKNAISNDISEAILRSSYIAIGSIELLSTKISKRKR